MMGWLCQPRIMGTIRNNFLLLRLILILGWTIDPRICHPYHPTQVALENPNTLPEQDQSRPSRNIIVDIDEHSLALGNGSSTRLVFSKGSRIPEIIPESPPITPGGRGLAKQISTSEDAPKGKFSSNKKKSNDSSTPPPRTTPLQEEEDNPDHNPEGEEYDYLDDSFEGNAPLISHPSVIDAREAGDVNEAHMRGEEDTSSEERRRNQNKQGRGFQRSRKKPVHYEDEEDEDDLEDQDGDEDDENLRNKSNFQYSSYPSASKHSFRQPRRDVKVTGGNEMKVTVVAVKSFTVKESDTSGDEIRAKIEKEFSEGPNPISDHEGPVSPSSSVKKSHVEHEGVVRKKHGGKGKFSVRRRKHKNKA